MTKICLDVVSESESNSACEQSSPAARRRRTEICRFKFVTDLATPENETAIGVDGMTPRTVIPVPTRDSENAAENRRTDIEKGRSEGRDVSGPDQTLVLAPVPGLVPVIPSPSAKNYPRYGVASVCGRRRDMEDAVAIHLDFCRRLDDVAEQLHYFGVYDGHGCSHVAMRCSERLHELVREELERRGEEKQQQQDQLVTEWRSAMETSFDRMDKEVTAWNMEAVVGAQCRCELQTPDCDAVGSTAVIAIVTPNKIVIANCGDSRAVLCRGGKAIPLSSDHKPDRPDELNRIQEAGGRVIYWDGPRVLGVLAMSRAIGDNYLKPYVSCEPEVAVVDRTAEDECLILGTDGLWDVVSNDTACGVARMCLRGKGRAPTAIEAAAGTSSAVAGDWGAGERTDKACSDASLLLTKLALARHSTDNVSIVVVDLRKQAT
ncbi:probable protein phosphatase 2C 24 [Punica granatum]|uniref:protein-serine/threonine phosphatase n=2 Tax=Punica granatum TaxID=22663 RepID=A0A218W2I8_PUNGR|nr:probable protein phosphatase 2C 24 [Punica granatum]OWM66739.1 hypothetical protein CDL15_Pgr010390 [Punica granatum]PKI36530.1 hypothetical protein CRG98_043083 [Punica granatum]